MAPGSSFGKAPCINCRASHQRCDKRKPLCKRCEKKGLDCQPVQRKAVFRHGSTASLDSSFSGGQTWVNSKPKNWRPTRKTSEACLSTQLAPHRVAGDSQRSLATPGAYTSENHAVIDSLSPLEPYENGTHQKQSEENTQDNDQFHNSHRDHGDSPRTPRLTSTSSTTPPAGVPDIAFSSSCESAARYKEPEILLGHLRYSDYQNLMGTSTAATLDISSPSSNDLATASSEAVQESCLLRYFIEELSLWFDHCDERRHFQLVVPRRAQHCATLRNAVFAVSARHLCRLPQYKTLNGIVYQGQLLPNLEKSSALEYMLKCIPDLVEFPNIHDPVHQENLMAATVILRQYEEMEEDMEESEVQSAQRGAVNFLAITHTIIDSMSASPLDSSLATATYWITVRQEVYFALTREAVPHLRFDADRWLNASIANTMIMFCGQVATWRWGNKSAEEWTQLKTQEHQLLHDSLGELKPTLDLKAERTKGQIFPTVWYNFDLQVTAAQHFLLAQMILTAENPNLDGANRATHRKAEAHVRSLVLRTCGIALCHMRIHPALVNAVIAITLYGEYFTNPDERESLLGIITTTNNIRAWPMRRQYEMVRRRWEVVDGVEV